MNKEELIKLSRENLRNSKQGSLCECYDEAFIKGYELSAKCISELEKENEKLKEKVSYLEDNLRVARKDREDLRLKVGKDLKEFIKDYPYSALKLYANGQYVHENEKLVHENEKLGKENAGLREKLKDVEKSRDYWKGSSFDWRHKCTSRKPFKVAVKAQKRLIKAKAIIKDLLKVLPKENIEGIYETIEVAEDFLREVEDD